MNLIVTLLLHSLSTPLDAALFQATDPHHLTITKAAEHLEAARFAGLLYRVDPNQLLGIAWHESRYTNAVTKEPGHRWSCGPMTPIPHRSRCTADEISTMGGYLKGAEHLRSWIDSHRCAGRARCGLLSYAGGGGLVVACARFGRSANSFHHDACRFAPDVMSHSAAIKRSLSHADRQIPTRADLPDTTFVIRGQWNLRGLAWQ